MMLRTWLRMSTTRSAALAASTMGVTLLLGILLLGLAMTVQVAHAQKGGKQPPATVLPAERYTLTWLDGGPGWEAVFPRDINQWGDVAGNAYDPNAQFTGPHTAFAFTAARGTLNLNELGAPWWDLNAAEPTLSGGWRATSAFGINDAGDIVGVATNEDPILMDRAFVLVNAFGDTPFFLLLPTVGAVDQYARRINNHGEIVGHAVGLGVIRYKRSKVDWPFYEAFGEIADSSIDGVMDINDEGVIVARASNFPSIGSYRQLISGTAPDYFVGHEFWSISNGGVDAMISGTREKTSGRNGRAGGAIRLPVLGTANDAQLIFSGTTSNYARAINDDGDLCFEASGRGYLYYDAINPNTGTRYGVNGDGILPLDKLVVNQDAGWLDNTYIIRFDGINNRDSTGLGQICGFAYGSDRGFLLTPFVPAN